MKRTLILILICFIVTIFVSCSGKDKNPPQEETTDIVTGLHDITRNGITCTVDYDTGMVKKVATGDVSLSLEGICIDVGFDGEYVFQQLGYMTFENANTWELPKIWARRKELPDGIEVAITEMTNGFDVDMRLEPLTVTYRYEMLDDALKLDAFFKVSVDTDANADKNNVTNADSDENQQDGNQQNENQPDVPHLINGVAFILKGIEDYKKVSSTFEFPGSTPGGRIGFANYSRYVVTATDYACPVVQLRDGDDFQNILFVNEHEKWSAGAYSNDEEQPCVVFLSATEAYIKAGEVVGVGSMYLPLTGRDGDPYLSVQEFWAQLSYHNPEDSVNDGPVYSCHPYGTMDTNYFNRWTLDEYAGQLADIADMGFKNVWLLPIFWHTGGNVYEPIDQAVINERYGGEEGAAAFIDQAHSLGLRVLFDLVPHGPRPVYEFAKVHDDWVSKDKEGNNQIEWECVSFDYNNQGYYDYTVSFINRYARELGLDGARIDCAMGGLSNWQPVSGLRASSSGLMGGVNITKAVKEGFVSGGITPILLPENFHPIPYYAQYTDIFYDMPLYRMMHNLNHKDISDAEYVKALSMWLDAEGKTSVKGQVKLRFLGNHDTVTWTFDAERPQTLYGVNKAKALWSALSFIDGVPFIYQGDEDPETYGLQGENLKRFFRDTFAARATYLPMGYGTTYIDSGSPVFAFLRHDEGGNDVKLVLVNLSEEENAFDIDGYVNNEYINKGNNKLPLEENGLWKVVYELYETRMADGIVVVPAYGVVIMGMGN